jgi:leader peptidase (prepilin peptidase)/N-methyltransferase
MAISQSSHGPAEDRSDDPICTRLTVSEAGMAAAAALGAFLAFLAVGLALPVALAGAGLGSAMLAIALVDRRSFLIPDWLSLPAIPLGVIAAGSAINPLADTLAPPSHLIGAGVGALSFYALALVYRRLRARDGLGLGDVKLAAAAGAWVGIGFLADVLLIACAGALFALAFRLLTRRDEPVAATTPLPFGAFLAPAIWIVWVWQQVV